MNQLIEWLSRMFSSWKFWIVVPPWDVGVRVRLGKVAAEMRPGLHFRIPMIDEIVLVNTRLRMASTSTVTVAGSGPNRARVITAQVGFSIKNPVDAMLRFTEPGSAIVALAQSGIADGLTADETRDRLAAEFEPHGVEVLTVYYTENVEVRTYRLLNGGGGGIYMGASGSLSYPGQQHSNY